MTSADDNPLFFDTNILVYASVVSAPQHQTARQAIQGYATARATIWISRQILREFLAVITRPQSFAAPLPGPNAARLVRSFAARFGVVEATAAVAERLLVLVESLAIGGAQIHDANIVATMREYDIGRLLTNNPREVARFAGLIDVIAL